MINFLVQWPIIHLSVEKFRKGHNILTFVNKHVDLYNLTDGRDI